MGNLSKNFDSVEFACHCGCAEQSVNTKLIDALEVIRSRVGKPIMVLSGRRCEKHNAAVGGVKNSQHKLGNAADIRVDGLSPSELHKIIESVHQDKKAHIGGLGLYGSFVHVDVRDGIARWKG